ncbi:MAG TPA: hypothetical protein VK473_19810 [Terriglobales bacterium]|nr:hypothetical protein [Terriglobales bacterium]
MEKVKVVREWDSEIFHAKVLELERQGWESRRETYRVTAEMNPETGVISHVYSIELRKPEG